MDSYAVTDIEVRNDGIYVLINQNSSNVKNDILRMVKKYQIQDVDYNAIDDAILNKLSEQRISTNTEIISKNEKMDIDISEDKMRAMVKFEEPVYKGSFLTAEDMKKMLEGNGIRFGIDVEEVIKLAKEKEYGKWYPIAEGEYPTDGTDGYNEYLFSTEKKTLKPKELENGSVDYRNIDYFETANSNQTLAISHPAVPGKDGMNVLGKINPSTKCKQAPRLPKGKNTKILEDGITLVSEIAGRILYADGRVSILPVLEIGGDVGNETGNIDFIGSVIVKGNVVSGFSVIAGADIEIEGSVEENVVIRANGNIMLMNGVHGGGKTVIDAGIDINANFIENSKLHSGGNITSNSIMHTDIKCGGSLTLIGKRGLLVGGKIVVGEKIRARTIGSVMSTLTDIEVGVSPDVLESYREAVKNIEDLNSNYEKTLKIIDILSNIDVSQLPEEKKKILMDSIRSKIVIKSKINETQATIDSVMPLLNKKSGKIEVSDVIYNGVKVMINNAVMYVRDNLDCCTLYNGDGKIRIGTYL